MKRTKLANHSPAGALVGAAVAIVVGACIFFFLAKKTPAPLPQGS